VDEQKVRQLLITFGGIGANLLRLRLGERRNSRSLGRLQDRRRRPTMP